MKPALLPGLLLSALLLACGAPPQPDPSSLGALAGRSVQLTLDDTDLLGDTVLAGAHRVTLELVDLPDGTCTRLADAVSATLNGEPMRLERGGVADVPGRTQCLRPTATFDYDPALWAAEPVQDLELLLEEPGQSPVRLRVGAGKAKRRFAVVAPTRAGVVRPGETRRYTYAPATDAGGEVYATLRQPGSSAGGQLAAALEPDGRVRVDIPATVPGGNQELLLGRSVPAQVLACEGLAACAGALRHEETVAVDIIP